MYRDQKIVTILVSWFSIALLLLLFGCTKKDNVYRIGVIGPLTGEGATYGTAMKQGIDIAIEEINSQGGINGVKLEAIYEDSKLQSKEGVNVFRKLVNAQNVPVVIGAAASRVTLSIAPFAEQQKVVLISTISTADELKTSGEYIFRNVPPNSRQGETASEFVKEHLNSDNAAIFYKNDDYGSSLAKAFRTSFISKSGKIVYDASYGADQNDFRNELSKLKKTNPQVVFMPGNYQDNAIILRQARETGINVPFVLGDGAFSEELIKLAGSAAQNVYVTMMGFSRGTALDNFLSAFKTKYGEEEPNVFVYYAYDALKVVAKAIEIGGYNSDGIKDALYSMEYEGLTGKIKFDEYGEVDKSYSLYRVQNNKFALMDWMPSEK